MVAPKNRRQIHGPHPAAAAKIVHIAHETHVVGARLTASPMHEHHGDARHPTVPAVVLRELRRRHLLRRHAVAVGGGGLQCQCSRACQSAASKPGPKGPPTVSQLVDCSFATLPPD
jgi:hypothetical protein